MGQFIFGLIAGIVVSLVMEWVIDWTGLLPKRPVSKGTPQNPVQNRAGSGAKRVDEQPATETESSLPNPDTTGG